MVNSSQDLGWMALPLPQSVVTAWICDNIGEQGDANKGVRLRLSTEAVNGLSRIGFSSSEAIQTDLRPVLVIKTKEINNAGKGDIDSSKLKVGKI